jgi:hypothetical protein
MQVTKKNHYNPCFWIAHWNRDYLDAVLAGRGTSLDVRTQPVNVLNVKANKVMKSTAENVHFDKKFCIADITVEAAKRYAKRCFPKESKKLLKELDQLDGEYFLDLEPLLTTLEGMQAYTTLKKVIATQQLDNELEKAFLGSFLHLQQMRSHAHMRSMVETTEEIGFDKFEYFVSMTHCLQDRKRMAELQRLLTTGQWILYTVKTDSFPLTDSPVLIRTQSVMVALSPRLLLEIDRQQLNMPGETARHSELYPSKLEEFRRRTIGNTFREIIFSDAAVLEDWRQSLEFQERHRLMTDVKTYNRTLGKYGDGELYKINAFGNMM